MVLTYIDFMLFAIFIYPVTFILQLLFGLFPIITVPANVVASLQSAGSSLQALNSFLPVDTFALIVGIYLGVEVAIKFLQLFRWLFGHIPIIGAGFR